MKHIIILFSSLLICQNISAFWFTKAVEKCCTTIATCQQNPINQGKEFVLNFSYKNITTLSPFPPFCGYDSYDIGKCGTVNGEVLVPSAVGSLSADKINIIKADHNLISRIYANSFYDFINLTNFDLSYNSINWIEAEAFQGLEALFTLDLSHNALATLNSDMFIINRITTLESPPLAELLLNNNQISAIKPGTFRNLANLEILNISFNNLTELPDLSTLAKITRLIFDGNQINFINPDVFATTPPLLYFSLADNKLDDTSNLIDGLVPLALTLRVLDLRGNNLSQSYQNDLRASLPSTIILF